MSDWFRPRSTATTDQDQHDALAAPTADPLWFLARQWQTGAFAASDGGTPIRTSVAWNSGDVAVQGGVLRGPVEPGIEAELLPAIGALDLLARTRLAVELLRTLGDEGVATRDIAQLQMTWERAYPIGLEARTPSEVACLARRLPDPAQLYTLLRSALRPDGTGGPLPSLPGLGGAPPDIASRAEAALRRWVATTSEQVVLASDSGRVDPAAWISERLEYAFECRAQLPTADLTLSCSDYEGAGVDWYAFDRTDLAPQSRPAPDFSSSTDVRPAPVSYTGMPRPRWWEFEDGDVNLDALRSSSDPARSLLATFAHDYANDWFVCPLDLSDGWSRITSVTVVDTFGEAVEVPAVSELDGDTGPWRMYELTGPPRADDPTIGLRLWWSVAPTTLEGPAIEEILLARDEMANLAWAVELLTSDGSGLPVDRYRRWLELRPPAATPSSDMGRYVLGTPIPDFWYPLAPHSNSDRRLLTVARVPDDVRGVDDEGVAGVLVAHDGSTRILDEEIPRGGKRVMRRDRLIVGPDGVEVWRARIKTSGSADSSSGLRFDVLT